MKFAVAAIACLAFAAAPAAHAAMPDAKTFAEVDKIFGDWGLSAHAPGMVWGVVVDGKLVHVKGAGVQDLTSKKPIAADSLFRIASMSKAFTGLAILKLRDEGKLSLDAPAELYVPEMKAWKYPTADSPKITVRNLLAHTSGFVEDNPWGDRQQVISEAEFTRMLADGVPFATTPGTEMEYSNFGYATLGRIITNVSGKPYQDYIRQELMAPLGMSSTTFDIFASPPARRAIGYRWQDGGWTREPDMKDGVFGAMGGVETSADDYAKWVAFLLSAWPARDEAEKGPVRRSTVREVAIEANPAGGAMRSAAIGGAPCRQSGSYGMGWRVLDDCDLGQVLTHTGGYPGYGSVVVLLPEKGVGIFAFASRTYGAPSVPAFRAALAMQKAGTLPSTGLPVSSGLARAYDAAKAVWRAGDINAAPLANNVLLDRDAGRWKTLIAGVKSDVGACSATEAIVPISAMEGRFTWTCEHGRVSGRVQRAPTPTVTIQALEFSPAAP